MQNGKEYGGSMPLEERAIAEKALEIEVLVEKLDEEVLELIEIEAHVSAHKRKPKARIYAFLVGKTRIEVREPEINGRRILELAGKVPPEKYTLRQIEHGGILKVIELNEVIDLREPCVERFRAMPRTANDG